MTLETKADISFSLADDLGKPLKHEAVNRDAITLITFFEDDTAKSVVHGFGESH